MVVNQGNQHKHKTAASSCFSHVRSMPSRKRQMPLKPMPSLAGLADYLVASPEISKLVLVLLVHSQALRKRSK